MRKILGKIFSLEFWEDVLVIILRPAVIVVQKLGVRSRKKIILTSAIFIMVMAGVFGWKSFYALAQQFIDSFTDTSRVASTWNVDVDTGTGEVKLAARTCDDGVWFCNESTVCTNTLGDGSHIIVKRTNETGSKQWKPTNTDCNKPECGQDGGQDGDNLVADNTVNFSGYPARDACKSAGGRLPTITELNCIYANRTTFGNNFGTAIYWSATEYSPAGARVVDFSSGNSTSSTKYYNLSVRCVKGW